MLKIGKQVWINLREAEKQFGVSRETLRRAVNEGKLKAMRVSRNQTLVKPEDVRKWVETSYNREMARRALSRWQREGKSVKKQKKPKS